MVKLGVRQEVESGWVPEVLCRVTGQKQDCSRTHMANLWLIWQLCPDLEMLRDSRDVARSLGKVVVGNKDAGRGIHMHVCI